MRGPLLSVLGKEVNHGPIEGRNVLRLAAAHPVAITNHFSVLPNPTSIADVILNRMVTREVPSLNEPG